MALRITKNQGIFEIKGSIVAENTKSLQHHFEKLLFNADKVVVYMDKVKKIDASGVSVLTKLFRKAMESNKIFHIIGKENKKVSNAFGKVNYILRSDFV
ncbi:STAS domain-containing protein [Aquimarina sp. MAR_2010_214]|uniref:STAS domain-containing protein n=1 Tax=Aquimarina sp. MAR_2010_214 TaxID=1250026 RepID=UPI000C70D2E0|nr:STAS domain-containing protein [Aquimarina sp. MAR_2010_214]PKV53028.1 STAS domain-containing protein [Aquimarina sp. MAR_2010_214]